MAKKTEKYVHKGFSWNLRGPIDQKAKSFVLAAHGGDNPETYQMLRKQEGGEPDWEELAIRIALGHELASKPLREASQRRKDNG